jgi:hypothetical protein
MTKNNKKTITFNSPIDEMSDDEVKKLQVFLKGVLKNPPKNQSAISAKKDKLTLKLFDMMDETDALNEELKREKNFAKQIDLMNKIGVKFKEQDEVNKELMGLE